MAEVVFVEQALGAAVLSLQAPALQASLPHFTPEQVAEGIALVALGATRGAKLRTLPTTLALTLTARGAGAAEVPPGMKRLLVRLTTLPALGAVLVEQQDCWVPHDAFGWAFEATGAKLATTPVAGAAALTTLPALEQELVSVAQLDATLPAQSDGAQSAALVLQSLGAETLAAEATTFAVGA